MIIHDQIQSLNSLKSALQVRGFNCVAFQDPLEAVSNYSSERYDLVITDFSMPEKNGLEVMDDIHLMNPEAKVILITGYPEKLSQTVFQQIHPDWFFTKPLERFRFFDTIRDLKTKISENKHTNIKGKQAVSSL